MGPAARTVFELLKEQFTSAPILKLPDSARPFVVEVDAPEVELGGVLSQYYGDPRK